MRTFITPNGDYAIAATGVVVPEGFVEVPSRPVSDATWDGEEWIIPPSGPSPVPSEISKVQFIRALRLIEWGEGTAWDAAKSAIAAAPADVQEDWDAITSVPRQDDTVLSMSDALAASASMDPEDMADLMDGAFLIGATL